MPWTLRRRSPESVAFSDEVGASETPPFVVVLVPTPVVGVDVEEEVETDEGVADVVGLTAPPVVAREVVEVELEEVEGEVVEVTEGTVGRVPVAAETSKPARPVLSYRKELEFDPVDTDVTCPAASYPRVDVPRRRV